MSKPLVFGIDGGLGFLDSFSQAYGASDCDSLSGSGQVPRVVTRVPRSTRFTRMQSAESFDVIMVWSVDRLGRSLKDLVEFLTEMHGAKINLFILQQGVDTTTPGGRALFQMMGVFAEFERAMIQERIRAGLDRARAFGTKSGRPAGRPRIDAKTEKAIGAALKTGKEDMHKIAKRYGVGTGTVQRIKAAMLVG